MYLRGDRQNPVTLNRVNNILGFETFVFDKRADAKAHARWSAGVCPVSYGASGGAETSALDSDGPMEEDQPSVDDAESPTPGAAVPRPAAAEPPHQQRRRPAPEQVADDK